MTMKRIQIETAEDIHDYCGPVLRDLVIAAEPLFREQCGAGQVKINGGGLTAKEVRHLVSYFAGVAEEEACIKHMEMKPWRP